MTHSEYSEHFAEIDGQKIGYSKYGHGATNMLTICGGVGCYAKDWPLSTLEHFDPEKYTIISIDPPGYGKSRPPERVQNVFRCQKDAVICMKLMEQLELLPFTAVGWSEGSRTALHLAANGIQKINRCVAMAATTRIEKRAVEVTKGMKNTDLWLPADREPYLKHCSNEFFKKQWADIMDTAEECYNMLGGRFPCDASLAENHLSSVAFEWRTRLVSRRPKGNNVSYKGRQNGDTITRRTRFSPQIPEMGC
ncbi:unnamed protein product, partial [Mesorhabditis belari]|uniref:AB hydrolase-1 domain-containing protein n=1 Tax=Mesorhabditis belari TaxID=2138241 RepID=A0AAF3ESA8_9BILA